MDYKQILKNITESQNPEEAFKEFIRTLTDNSTYKEFNDDKNILLRASEIVFDKKFNGTDSIRNYPDFDKSILDLSAACSIILKKEITSYDILIIQVLQKLNRDGHKRKYDNILDALSYLAEAYKLNKDQYEH